MTSLLEKAFNKAAALEAEQQDIFAKWILEALEDEQFWDQQFASSLDILEILAAEARQEHKANQTEPLAPDAL